ncbi:response regulator [Devosia sp. MC532]|uniref:cell cycle histidine kinase CckA n=1 Tax=unclassified Devosia TaxID=196773 RepID=UPI0018F68C73|nr:MULTISPECIES: PAS domain-containing sensor histidine kinase [unclassified Devosia]MBJ7577135.1 response regulator [Devosia sp. MC532]MBK1793635.1 response regulator [Devosia sp. WQ 349K1]
MARTPLGEHSYPEPVLDAARGGTGLWRVILLGAALIAAAVVFSLFGDRISPEIVMSFVGLLAVAGVFFLFGLAANLFRFASTEERRTVNHALVDSMPFGVLIADRDGKISYVNHHYGSFPGGVTNGVPVGVPRLFAGYADASEAVYRLSRAAKEGRNAIEDIRIPGGLGGSQAEANRVFWYRVAVRPLPASDETTKPLVTWSVEDITRDRENNETAFRDLQRAIDYLDHSPSGFFSADAQGRIQYLNSTLADWLGYDLAEFNVGQLALSDIVRGDGASLLMRGRGDGEIRTEIIDIDFVRRNGTTLPVRLLHRAARLADGELGETRTLVLDRSSAPDNEEALRAAEVRFSRFFNDTPFAIATLDGEGRIVRTNAPFSRIFQWSGEAQSLELHPVVDLVDGSSRDKLVKAIADAMSGRSAVEPVDATLNMEGDHAVRLYISASELSAGSPEQVNVYALDMTDQRKLEAQFAQSQKMQAIGQLAGGIAHDFNNLLTAIIGFSDLLLLKHKLGDPSFNELMQIKQNANRAAGLTRQLLAFSRRQTLRPQVLELPLIVDDLTVLLKRMIGEKNQLAVDHGRDIWPVRADVVQLEQVIINLVVNARDAMPNGGSITIRTSNVGEIDVVSMRHEGMPAADYVLIEVEDTGTGMSPEILQKIFDPFFTTKELGKGTGLGLSTVYGIVKQTEGFIYPVSTVGVGTTFKIFLPRHVPTIEEVQKAAIAAAVPAKDLTGHERILLVEDEESVRAFSARALRATGYEVLEADSGEEAIWVLEDHNYEVDLIISDVVMPEMDGPTMLKSIRGKIKNLKIIFVSGYAEESVRRDIEDDQSVDFLPKPYSLDDINSKVKEVLQRQDKPN